MACISSALVVGGSIAGMNAAIALARQGVRVDLVELAEQPLGASLAFSGRAAETLVELGIYDEVHATGTPFGPDSTAVSIHDSTGRLISAGPKRPTWPGAVDAIAVYRPVFLDVAEAAAKRLGVRVRKGVTYETIDNGADAVAVTFTDGETGSYDLLVAADGIGSRTRGLIFPDAPKPKFGGQLSIRWMAPGPAIEGEGWYVSPVGRLGFYYLPQGMVYVPSVIDMPEWRWLSDEDVRSIFVELLDSMTAPPVAELRSRFDANAQLIGRPFDWILLPDPWFSGRVVLIGDAAHATSAHMGMGGGMALEDAVVLGQSIADAATLPEALAAFMGRRFERVKLVVETSVRLGRLEQEKAPPSENAALLTRAFAALGEPY
ncbi:NAD(P)-binding protein [Sphingomonas sp. CL5.1]|uniref:FAD-dependent monooxygenase n=1 Tax=Sphingomonas sp. CL5.1 TaxID=2653203 RepID=UPI001581A3D3|nr:FAD-dependent monooxygenase [Sphingomonas sp. CL5.1]QKR99801.1 NAD(P)-binding protein [Sphingomonas sp. CL5.1]